MVVCVMTGAELKDTKIAMKAYGEPLRLNSLSEYPSPLKFANLSANSSQL